MHLYAYLMGFLFSKDFGLKKLLDDSLCYIHHISFSVRLSFDDIIYFVLCASGQNLNETWESFVISPRMK